ncbi:excinuclease ABC, C subunit [Thermovibrio ammonificans HB-1]|uniref:UvrABC system protein C n=1 Tax=Thermovibrio ammonificans (strain DSM 15698 / JCM 12110 / HB-1) TaxID=648996 RepID=E8T2T7_THEA1|nr:excinuclease ABC subunit UvrC [Thermovibrio ammonificans]ADU97146.1 excinuclease ABC, C subunit [Thermovibrio ammonificans HB-1]
MKEKLKEVPELPGVYLFKDSAGKVLYVGKSKNLRERLSTHLNATDPNDKSYRIVRASADFDYIVVRNEREALALEAELIKEHLPPFNVLLKDGKSYPYLVVTDEEFPTVKVVRRSFSGGGERFGPFVPPKSAYNLRELLTRLFRLRSCKELKKRDKPCLQYHIERCTAPCAGLVSKKEYRKQVERALRFLKGDVKGLISELHSEIEEAAEKLEFERAARLRDQLIAVKAVFEKSAPLFEEFKECDIFYLEERGELFTGVKLTVRGGIIYGKESFHLDPVDPWDEGLLSSVFSLGVEKLDVNTVGTMWLKAYYGEEGVPAGVKLLANFKPLGDYEVHPIPEELLPLLRRNRRAVSYSLSLKELEREFEEVFGEPLPLRVECFDISTLQGEATVASCVVWEKGQFKKDEYRRFKVKSVSGVDDYASMEEVLTRRFRRIKRGEVKEPDLVIVDGGIGQLNVALKVRDTFGLGFRVFSIAKREEVVYTDLGEVVETKRFPHLFRFFTSIRDEAHRFALSYNRKLRTDKMLHSFLSSVKGIGPKRRALIEKLYPDLSELAAVSPSELAKLGIPLKVAREVVERARELFKEV